MQKWKVGDWAVEGYEVVQIKEMSGDTVTGITTGYFTTGSNSFNDSLFPLTLENKVAVEAAKSHMDKFHQEKGSHILNFPDLSRVFEGFAKEICAEKLDKREPIYKEMNEFARKVREKLQEVLWIDVDGLKIFGR